MMKVAGTDRPGMPVSQGESFRNRKRPGGLVTEVIVHETVTRSHADTLAVLRQRRLGVHLIVDEHGALHQHGDLQDDLLWHAGAHNGPSVGVEIVNPYEPRFLPRNGPWERILTGPWAAGGRYVVPTLAQLETTAALLAWLTTPDSGLSIPRAWVGLESSRLAMNRIERPTLRPGLWAHTYFAHADGAFPVLFAWLRLEAGLGAHEAFSTACALAEGARRTVDLSSFARKESS